MPDGAPKKPRWRRWQRRLIHYPTVAEASRAMTESYRGIEAMDIRVWNDRARDDLRMRSDGQPSARPPAATVPVSYWATVLDDPGGGEEGGTDEKLRQYQDWMQHWKDLGLYHGSTELKIVNQEYLREYADATRDASEEGTRQGDSQGHAP